MKEEQLDLVEETKAEEGNSNDKSTEKTTEQKPAQAKRKPSRSKSQAKSANVESKKKVDISSFVTNEKDNVYAIQGLPEEFIATLFAWVSRSPKSFRDHLEKAIANFEYEGANGNFEGFSDKAKAFHEKWTVGYGHSSVAEHAVAHVGIEKISRLASAELELSNTFLSITEYSQRYQKPARGEWHNPIDPKKDLSLHEQYEKFMSETFDVFEELITAVHEDLIKKHEEEHGKKPTTKEKAALEKLAFEDARYVLPLSMYTQLGMTANGRAWRDGLAVLGNSKHKESRDLAEQAKNEITKVLPVLLKYATPSEYQKNVRERMNRLFKAPVSLGPVEGDVRLVQVPTQQYAIHNILCALYMQETNVSFQDANFNVKSMTSEKKTDVLHQLLFDMKHFDQPMDAFKNIQYTVELFISEANWHQLLRHNRKTNFTYGDASTMFGIVIPPRIEDAGLSEKVKDIYIKANNLFYDLVEAGYSDEAQYVVLNACKRRVYASFDLWEAYHLINLRTSDEAQWEIRDTFNSLHEQLSNIQPFLFKYAKRRD